MEAKAMRGKCRPQEPTDLRFIFDEEYRGVL
jgi:hypothetical protein